MNHEEAREATQDELARNAHRLDVSAEIQAMQRAFEALYKLDDESKRRAMRWLEQAIWNSGLRNGDEVPF